MPSRTPAGPVTSLPRLSRSEHTRQRPTGAFPSTSFLRTATCALAVFLASFFGVLPAQALTGGPYLDLIVATDFDLKWKDTGSGAYYDATFWHPKNLPAGYYPLGSFGHGYMTWSSEDADRPQPTFVGKYEARSMLVAKELVSGSLRAPIDYRLIWTDAGSGADLDGSMWEPIPAPGFVCLGTVAQAGYGKPSLDAVRCVHGSLVVEARFPGVYDDFTTGPFWSTSGSGADSDFGAIRIVSKDEHEPEYGIDAGTFLGYSPYSAINGVKVWAINSAAVARVTPMSAGEVEASIQAYAPQIRLHPNDEFRPDSATAVLNDKTRVCWGVVRNDSSFDNINVEGGSYLCRFTSAATILDDEAIARTDPRSADPDFKVFLFIDDSTIAGNLPRATSYVRVKATNRVYLDIQLWLYYPYNGPAYSRVIFGDILDEELNVAPTGRHYSDWEYVTLRFARSAWCGGCLAFSHIIASGHSSLTHVTADDPRLQYVGTRPVIYSAYHSHAMYLAAGTNYHKVLKHTDLGIGEFWVIGMDYTADGGPAWEIGAASKHVIVSSEWPDLHTPSPAPDWLFFPGRWGQYEQLPYVMTNFLSLGIPATPFSEVGAGPSGPLTKSSWPDVRDTTSPLIEDIVSGTQGNGPWYTSDVTVSWKVTDPEGTPGRAANCATSTITADTNSVEKRCDAYSEGGRSASGLEIKVDKTPPTTPVAPTTNSQGPGQVIVDWAPSSDASGSGLAGYKVERCTGGGCASFAEVGTTPGAPFVDNGVQASTSYSYRVRAYDVAGNGSAYSATTTIVTIGGTTPGPGPGPSTAMVTEFYHPAFDHYFMTAVAAETANLTAGKLPPWVPTGRTFNVWSAAGSGVTNVWRFFSASFAPQSGHFYTNNPGEAASLQAGAVWVLEDANAFYMMASPTGTCPAGTIPLYRLYNNGQGGSPNHRYTTDLGVRATMIAQGWVPEGNGATGVFTCVPG